MEVKSDDIMVVISWRAIFLVEESEISTEDDDTSNLNRKL